MTLECWGAEAILLHTTLPSYMNIAARKSGLLPTDKWLQNRAAPSLYTSKPDVHPRGKRLFSDASTWSVA